MSQSRRQAVNVTVEKELLARARALDVNISSVLDGALTKVVVAAEAEVWRKANRKAIEAYNLRVGERGILSDDERLF